MQFLLINAFDCLATSLFIYLLVNFRDRRRRGGLSYPPGPPSWPIIGNLLDVPKNPSWTAYADMSKKYGDIICLRVYSQVIIVVCSLSAIKDLFEKRGQIYSVRHPVPVIEMMEMDWPIFMTGMNETWRKGRKLLYRGLRPGAIISYRQMMQEKTRELIAQLRANPKDFYTHVEELQGKIIMSLTYGYDLKDGDKMLEAPVQAAKLLSPLIRPGAALINHLPFLRHIPSWVPYLSYKPLAGMIRKLSKRVRNEPMDFVKNALRNGTAVHSLASECLQELECLPDQKLCVFLDIPASFLLTHTIETVSSMTFLFLALVLFPEVQRRAQAELDVVIGRDRLPTFNDRPRLPYMEAMCKELLRWQMVVPISFSRVSSKDDVYRGFFIPKGTMIVANVWAILHDPEIYPDPEEFKPERFLDEDGSVRDDPALSLVFGNGKRICPGRHLVDATIFIVSSSVLSIFNVTKAKDEYGHEIPVELGLATDQGFVVHPKKFECSIVPRDKVAEALISANALS
ncbi:cytochrome P450 [Russula ochroleuca]|uniref:Cytochrome P450 n=1 Tax=Russula ochroleuca TaxID=152965 RepID=A0A9P5TC31_9AGAM|nr:cytochrome P450 [Russula ochroleuca]